jgi:hypothetical protein
MHFTEILLFAVSPIKAKVLGKILSMSLMMGRSVLANTGRFEKRKE